MSLLSRIERNSANKAAWGEAVAFYRDVVLPYDGNECLIWPFGRNSSGYARVYIDRRGYSASRLVCQHIHGEPTSPELQAAHSCGRGAQGCVTGRHLLWKTPAGNTADKYLHGTILMGEKSATAKLTEDQVKQIRSLRGSKLHREIAEQFGIHKSTVGYILQGRRWGHVA